MAQDAPCEALVEWVNSLDLDVEADGVASLGVPEALAAVLGDVTGEDIQPKTFEAVAAALRAELEAVGDAAAVGAAVDALPSTAAAQGDQEAVTSWYRLLLVAAVNGENKEAYIEGIMGLDEEVQRHLMQLVQAGMEAVEEAADEDAAAAPATAGPGSPTNSVGHAGAAASDGADAAGLRRRVADLEAQLAAAQARAGSSGGRGQLQETAVEEMMQGLAEKEQELEVKSAAWARREAELKRANQRLEEELQELQDQVGTLSRTEETVKRLRERLQGAKDTRDKLKAAQQELQELAAQNGSLEEQLKGMSALRQQLEEQRSKAIEGTSAAARTQAHVGQLQTEVEELQEANEALRSQSRAAEARARAAESQLEAARAGQDAAGEPGGGSASSEELHEATMRLRKAEAAREALESQLAEARASAGATAEQAAAEQRAGDLAAELAAARADKEAVEAHLQARVAAAEAQAEQQAQELRVREEALQGELSGAERARRGAEARAREVEAAGDALQERLVAAERERSEAVARVAKLEEHQVRSRELLEKLRAKHQEETTAQEGLRAEMERNRQQHRREMLQMSGAVCEMGRMWQQGLLQQPAAPGRPASMTFLERQRHQGSPLAQLGAARSPARPAAAGAASSSLGVISSLFSPGR